MRRRRQTGGHQRSGPGRAFSVVELLVALGIFTFGIAAVYEHYLGLGTRAQDQLQRVQARLLAHQELEKLRAAGPARLASWEPPAAPAPLHEDLAFYSNVRRETRADGAVALTVQVWRAQESNSTPPALCATARGVVLP